MNQQQPSVASEKSFNRACESCRRHKVRCLPEGGIAGSKICQRCSRTERECVWTAPQRRKQRKRTDTRVAELEREVSAMRALFHEKKVNGSGMNESSAGPSRSATTKIAEAAAVSMDTIQGLTHSGIAEKDDIAFSTPSATEWSPPPYSLDSDVVDRGILSMQDAIELIDSYNKELVYYYPLVVIEAGITAEELRKLKPTLFLAIIAAAAGKRDPYLYSVLNSEVISAYAHRTVIRGEKSLELVQSMIVTSIFYYPPGKFSRLKFYEYIHMAAVMALDIGLGTNPRTSRTRQRLDESPASEANWPQANDCLERKRTLLACYLITTAVAMSMRRPNMLRYNDWIDECLATVANDSNNTYLDRLLASWVRLIKINEDFAVALSWDNPSNMANLSDARVQIMVSGFEKTLLNWRNSHEPHSTNLTIMLAFYHSQLYLHEVALHDDHLAEDFAPPFFDLGKVLSIHIDLRATSSHIDSTSTSISSAHSILDILLNMDVQTLRGLPIFKFARMAYAFVILIKLYISSKTPRSRIGAAIKTEQLRLGYYLQAVIRHLTEAVRPKEYRAPFTFLGMLLRYNKWLNSQEGNDVFIAPKAPISIDDCWVLTVPKNRAEGHFEALSNESDDLVRSQNPGAVVDGLVTAGFLPLTTEELIEYPQNDAIETELNLEHYMNLGNISDYDWTYDWMSDMGISSMDPMSTVYSHQDWDLHGNMGPNA